MCCSSLVFILWSQDKLMSLATERSSDIKYSCKHENYENYKLFTLFLEETHNLFKRWPLNLWWISNKTIIEVGNIIYKSCYFQKLSSQKLWKHTITFFMTVLFNFFMRQTLADDLDDFWGSHKNMNCAFPLQFALFNQGSLTFLV